MAVLTVVLAASPIPTDIYRGSEAREALVARAILEQRDWVLPLWNGSVVPSKPPLYHWLVASAAAVTGAGVSEWTLRLPSVLLALAVVLAVCWAGCVWGGRDVGVMSALVLATTPQFIAEASNGRVDMTLTGGVVAAQLLVAEAFRRPPTRWFVPAATAVGTAAAMLAKGPVGPGIVGLTALAMAMVERTLTPIRRLVRPVSVLPFLALAGGWYVLAWVHRGEAFLAKQIFEENGQAILGGSRVPARSMLHYVQPLFLGGAPWTLTLPWAVRAAWRGGTPRRYAVLWAAVGFVFFSLAPLKRDAYLLPLRPAIALVVGWWLADAVKNRAPAARPARAAALLAYAMVGVAAGAVVFICAMVLGWGTEPLVMIGARHRVNVRLYVEAVREAAWGITAVVGAVGGAAWVTAGALRYGRWRGAVLGTVAVVAGITLIADGVFVPTRAVEKSIRPFAETIRARVPPGAPLALLASGLGGEAETPLIFYVGRDIPVRPTNGRQRSGMLTGYYVMRAEQWDEWAGPNGWQEIERSRPLFSRHRPELVLVRRRRRSERSPMNGQVVERFADPEPSLAGTSSTGPQCRAMRYAARMVTPSLTSLQESDRRGVSRSTDRLPAGLQ